MQWNVIKEEKKLVYVDLLMDKHFRKQIIDRLKNQKHYRVMVYGAGRIAKCLDNVVEDSEVSIVCFIDKANRWDFCGKKTIGIEDIPKYDEISDAVVISNLYYFKDIINDIGTLTKNRIISLDDLLREED